jgi:hypothetical protein
VEQLRHPLSSTELLQRDSTLQRVIFTRMEQPLHAGAPESPSPMNGGFRDMGFPADNPARPPPTLVSEICRLDLQLLEMQCSRPPTLTLQRASYPRIKHFDIFPPFFRDLSQEPSFCICGWKLVSNQEWIAGFRFLLSS